MDFNLNKSGLTADLRRHLRRSLSCFIKGLRHIFYKWTLTGKFPINIACLFTDHKINRSVSVVLFSGGIDASRDDERKR